MKYFAKIRIDKFWTINSAMTKIMQFMIFQNIYMHNCYKSFISLRVNTYFNRVNFNGHEQYDETV